MNKEQDQRKSLDGKESMDTSNDSPESGKQTSSSGRVEAEGYAAEQSSSSNGGGGGSEDSGFDSSDPNSGRRKRPRSDNGETGGSPDRQVSSLTDGAGEAKSGYSESREDASGTPGGDSSNPTTSSSGNGNGSESTSSSDKPAIDRQAKRVKAAIEGFSDRHKSAYCRALQICPSLVETESKPMFFLRCEDYDALAAAKRLLSYWDKRNQIFQERTFYPMTICRQGALSDQDIEELKTGFLSFRYIPNSSGFLTLLDDMTKDYDASIPAPGAQALRASRERCRFYMLSIAGMSETMFGLNWLRVAFLDPRDGIPGLKQVFDSFHIAQHVPVGVAKIYNCLITRAATIKAAVDAEFERFVQDSSSDGVLHLIIADSLDELSHKLQQQGVIVSSWPLSSLTGGPDSIFQAWMEDQLKQERTTQMTRQIEFISKKRSADSDSKPSENSSTESDSTLENMKHQFSKISDTNLRLGQENRFLRSCLEQASSMFEAKRAAVAATGNVGTIQATSEVNVSSESSNPMHGSRESTGPSEESTSSGGEQGAASRAHARPIFAPQAGLTYEQFQAICHSLLSALNHQPSAFQLNPTERQSVVDMLSRIQQTIYAEMERLQQPEEKTDE